VIGGEFILTGDGFVVVVVVSALFGMWCGWMGGKAEGRDQERERVRSALRHRAASALRQAALQRAATAAMQSRTTNPVPSQGTT